MAKKPLGRLTKRDAELIRDIALHRYLTVGQVQRLHFPSEQTTYRRLRALKSAGLVKSFQVAGIEESLVALESEGARMVAESAEKSTFGRAEKSALPKDYYFVRHFIAVNDFWIRLRLASSSNGVRLVDFIPDSVGLKSRTSGMGRLIADSVQIGGDRNLRLSHTPDAVFVLGKEDRFALFFLEVDRGTEVVSDPLKGVLKAVRFYLEYFISGGYQRYARDAGVDSFRGCRAVYLTTSDIRARNMRDAASKIEGYRKAKRFLWLTTFEAIARAGIFAGVFKSFDKTDLTSYSMAGRDHHASC